jgi:hypothetical protein
MAGVSRAGVEWSDEMPGLGASLETRLFGLWHRCGPELVELASSGPEPALRRRRAAGGRPACVGQLTWVVSLSSSWFSPRCWTTRHGHEGQRRVATNQPMSTVGTRGRAQHARRDLRDGRLVARQHGWHLAVRHFRVPRTADSGMPDGLINDCVRTAPRSAGSTPRPGGPAATRGPIPPNKSHPSVGNCRRRIDLSRR